MSVLVAYDTLKIARKLADAGLDPKVAEGVSETFATALSDREDSLVTKSDMAAVRADIARVESRLDSLGHELRAEIKSANADTLKWVVGAMMAIAGLLFAAIKLFH